MDVATVAKALDVANILEGSVRKSGNKLRVTAQLIRAADSSHLWSQTYDRELTDVFKVQDEIAGAVVAALKLKLLPSQAVSNPHRTGNTDAYDQYLLGQQLLRGGVGDRQRAVAALQQAVALDPQFAAAYGGLAFAQMLLAQLAGSQAERVAAHKLALANVEKAIALDPGLSRAYLTRAFYRYPKGGVFRGRAREHDRNFVCCNARLLHFDRYPIASPGFDSCGRCPQAAHHQIARMSNHMHELRAMEPRSL